MTGSYKRLEVGKLIVGLSPSKYYCSSRMQRGNNSKIILRINAGVWKFNRWTGEKDAEMVVRDYLID